MGTIVTYHNGVPAVNVKVRSAGLGFWPREFLALPTDNYGAQEVGQTTAADCVDAAYNIVQSEFWATAEAIASERGIGDVTGGRSGGWLELPGLKYRLPCPEHDALGVSCDDEDDAMEGYSALRTWAEDYIGKAPARVARLAQQIAMDEVGRDAAERMFACS